MARHIWLRVSIVCFLAWVDVSFGLAAELPEFRHTVIDAHAGNICYALTAADVDGDGRQDIVVVTEDSVLWYQAPGWESHVIIRNQTERDNVCIAPADIDGDGQIDFALGAGWTKNGTIQWLSRRKSLEKNWRVYLIGHASWLHRMRFADVLKTGKPQLVISPLNRTIGDGVQLTAFEIPTDPKGDQWPATILDDELNRMHNHWHADLDGDGSIDTLTASREGVHLIRNTPEGWSKTRLAAGCQDDDQMKCGAGEIKVGRLAGGRPFIATVEPMHGTSAVVYTQSRNEEAAWQRHVIDDTLNRGHAVWAADLDGDGSDELIVGHSKPSTGDLDGPGLYVFDAEDDTGTRWMKHVLDNGGVAVEDVIAADFTSDGRIDIVACGRDTHNVKLYVNLGPAE